MKKVRDLEENLNSTFNIEERVKKNKVDHEIERAKTCSNTSMEFMLKKN